jgi:hypothetical protein
MIHEFKQAVKVRLEQLREQRAYEVAMSRNAPEAALRVGQGIVAGLTDAIEVLDAVYKESHG